MSNTQIAIGRTPSMQLCLNKTSREYSKYLVLHESGHALGLYHEQQHPVAEDKEAVISDLLQGQFKGKEAETYYTLVKSTKRDKDGQDCDPDMRYD